MTKTLTATGSVIYDLMASFEKLPRYQTIPGGPFDKESRDMWSKGQYYQDGHVNQAFRCFMAGYSFAVCYLREDD